MELKSYFKKHLLSLPYTYKDSYRAFYNNKGNLIILVICNIFIILAFLDQKTDYLKLSFYPTLFSSLLLQLVIIITLSSYKRYGINSNLFQYLNLLSQSCLIIFFTLIIYNTKEPRTGWWLLHFLFILLVAQLNLFHFLYLLLSLLMPSLVSTLRIIQGLPHSLYFLSYGYGVGIVASLLYFYQAHLRMAERKIQNKNIKLLKQVNKFKIVKEQERISRELHDSLGASLTGNIIYLEITRDLIDKDIEKAKETLTLIEKLSRDALIKMREVVYSITDNSKLLKDFVEHSRQNAKKLLKLKQVTLDFKCHYKDKIENLNLLSKFNLNLIITEWLTNIIKHSHASSVSIEFNANGNINITIQDNGQGFKEHKILPGNGIKNIKFRTKEINGKCNISSSKKGACLKITVPLA